MDLRQLYATILVGSSACHEFVKSPGHTGGFYHFVCPHGVKKYLFFTVKILLVFFVILPANLVLSAHLRKLETKVVILPSIIFT